MVVRGCGRAPAIDGGRMHSLSLFFLSFSLMKMVHLKKSAQSKRPWSSIWFLLAHLIRFYLRAHTPLSIAQLHTRWQSVTDAMQRIPNLLIPFFLSPLARPDWIWLIPINILIDNCDNGARVKLKVQAVFCEQRPPKAKSPETAKWYVLADCGPGLTGKMLLLAAQVVERNQKTEQRMRWKLRFTCELAATGPQRPHCCQPQRHAISFYVKIGSICACIAFTP